MNNSRRIYRAAIYVRLSKEDGDLDDKRKAESNSISNQKSLILNYLKDKEDIEVVSVREDDGYSGASFDRPAFKLMIREYKRWSVGAALVVKEYFHDLQENILMRAVASDIVSHTKQSYAMQKNRRDVRCATYQNIS